MNFEALQGKDVRVGGIVTSVEHRTTKPENRLATEARRFRQQRKDTFTSLVKHTSGSAIS